MKKLILFKVIGTAIGIVPMLFGIKEMLSPLPYSCWRVLSTDPHAMSCFIQQAYPVYFVIGIMVIIGTLLAG